MKTLSILALVCCMGVLASGQTEEVSLGGLKPAKVLAALRLQLTAIQASVAQGDAVALAGALCPSTTLFVPGAPALVLDTPAAQAAWAQDFVAGNKSAGLEVTLQDVTVTKPKGVSNAVYEAYSTAVYNVTSQVGKAILKFSQAPKKKSAGVEALGNAKLWCLSWAIWNADGPVGGNMLAQQ